MLRISKRKIYPKGDLKAAVNSVKCRKLSLSAASREYSVPRKTLSDHVKDLVGDTPGPAPMLTPDEEGSLVCYMGYMANQGFPLTRSTARVFIRSMVKSAGRPTLFNLESGPSDKWFRGFYGRHPELQERLPERQERSRSRMSNATVMGQYFNLLDKTLTDLNLKDKPNQIYNVDEIGFSGKECSRQKVTSVKGSHSYQQQVTTSDHITATVCISADGKVLPSCVTFSKSLPHRNYTEGVPSDWLFGVSETGYVDGVLFEEWFKRIFLPNCSRERPVLLLLDNHESHVRLEIVKIAREHDISLLGLPPHTTHILQPLDVAIFGPLKAHFSSMATKLGFVNSQMTIGKARFPFVLSHAIDQCCSPARIKDAFRKTGVAPLNPDAIDKTQLVKPSFVSDNRQDNEPSVHVSTCQTCGNFLVNPLVASGLIPQNLAHILVPPRVPAPRKRKNTITEARVLTGEEVVGALREKERKEREKQEQLKVRKEERERKKNEKNAKRDELLERKKVREERRKQKDERKKRVNERKGNSVKKVEERMTEGDESDHETLCKNCGLRDPVCGSEAVERTEWICCTMCDEWFHSVCVSDNGNFVCSVCFTEE